jgi:hypothetical protein
MTRTLALAFLGTALLVAAAPTRADEGGEPQGGSSERRPSSRREQAGSGEPKPAPATTERTAKERQLEPSGPRADDPDASLAPPGYAEAANLGLEQFDAGNYAEARSHFARAHELWPNARSLRLLAHAEYELKNYVLAKRLSEESLVSRVRALSDAQRVETEELLHKLRAYVAHYRIDTRPKDSLISIDGQVIALDALGGVFLDVGPHLLEVEAPGHQPRRRELEVHGTVDQELSIALEPLPVQYATRGPVDAPLRQKWWLWASVGAVATAALVTGLVVGLRGPETREVTGGSSGVVIRVPGNPAATQ